MVPGDYDGDSQMDVLLTAQIGSETTTTVFIFWGHNQTLGRALIVMGGGQSTHSDGRRPEHTDEGFSSVLLAHVS